MREEGKDTVIPFLGFDKNETWTEQQLAKNDVIEWEAEHMRILYEVAKIMDEKWYKTNFQLATRMCGVLQGRSSYKRASQPVKTILEAACCAVTDRQCAITKTSWFIYVAVGGGLLLGILLVVLIIGAIMLVMKFLKRRASSSKSGEKVSNEGANSPATPLMSPIASPVPPKKSAEKIPNRAVNRPAIPQKSPMASPAPPKRSAEKVPNGVVNRPQIPQKSPMASPAPPKRSPFVMKK